MNDLTDDLLLHPEFEFLDGEHRGVVRRHSDESWYVYDSDEEFIGYFAVANPVIGETQVSYTAGGPDELDSITDITSSDWRELVVWLLDR